MLDERYNDLKTAEKGAVISIVAYLFTATVKLIVGSIANSAALRADGFNNLTDIIASVAVLIGLRLARRPADADHKYGHWKVETVASMVTSFIMLMVGLQVLADALQGFITKEHVTPDLRAAFIAGISAIIMFGVYIYNKRLAKKVKSGALMSAAKDNLSDALTSIATAIAIIGARFNMAWLDQLMALIVGLMIIKTAFDIFSDSAFSLSDGFDESLLQTFKNEILLIDGIISVANIKGRNYGSNISIDVVVLMDPSLTVLESHQITEEIEDMLRNSYGVFETDVHVEPNI